MDDSHTLILRSRTAAELIASLPHLAGVPLDNSVVVAPFWGVRAPGALRIDLPPADGLDVSQGLAASFLAYLARMNGCDRVAVAVFTDEPYAEAVRDRHDLMAHLLERFHVSGYDIADAAIVAADGWGLFDHDRPRPLSEIAAAPPVPAALARHASRTLPPVEPGIAAAVEEQLFARLAHHADLDAFGRRRHRPLPDPVDLLEHALGQGPQTAGVQSLVHLLALLDSEGAVDRTVLQIAFGRETGERSWRRTLAVRAEAEASGRRPVDVLLDDHESGRRTPESARLGRMLTGECSERPSADRLHAGIALLGRAIVHCPAADRPWALCALAWLRWAVGLSKAADEALRMAAAIDPGNQLVPLYRTLVTHFLPSWIFARAADLGAGANRATRRTSRAAKRT